MKIKTKHIVIILMSYPLIVFLPLACCAKKKEAVAVETASKKVEKFDNILETMPNIGQYVAGKKQKRFSF